MQVAQKYFFGLKRFFSQLITGLFTAFILVSCSIGSERQGMLMISGTGTSPFNNSYHGDIKVSADLSDLSEDSLDQYEQLLLYGISADSLTAAHQRNVERFVSMGGQLYFSEVRMQYRRKWPLLENLVDQKSGLDKDSGNILASARQEVKSYSFGNGSIYYFPDDISVNSHEMAAYLAQNESKGLWENTSSIPAYPDPKRFTYTTLFSGLNEPMEIEVLPNQNILLIERGGAIKYYDHQLGRIKTIATLPVNNSQSNGLNGLAIYPDFRNKPWVFVSYSHASKPYQYISRFYLAGDSLIMNSEKVVMRVPHNPDDANHASNALEFDAAGNLYIGFGDYTAQPEGYAPIDERPGKSRRDAQRTAGNSNNPLGGILRIHPEDDGSYSIPAGNLFPENDSLSLAEIFVQGCRNPYRFSIDPKTQDLFFGDVGPDATVDSERGTQGYEEINLAKEAGYFGWPYFVAKNIAYPDYDYATQQLGKPFDPVSPHNDSPNNTGLDELPAAQPAILWYPRQPTTEFPGMAQGGMNIMVGPVFRSEHYPFSEDKLPDYFDGKLIFYDWVRGWVKAASLDEKKQVVQVEPFIDTLHFAHPTDMRLGPEGALYVLDYGAQSYAKNLDAKVVRISYARGNRKPVAKIVASKTEGALPLEVSLSAAGSFDYDQDFLEYAWMIEGKLLPGKEIKYQFEKPGAQTVRLEVTDEAGAVTEKNISIKAGNAPPEILLNTAANRSFYWPNQELSYQVEVTDQEDGSLAGGQIANEAVMIRFSFQSLGEGENRSGNIHDIPDGKLLVQENGCVACHGLETRSLGPSYNEVAKRYKGQDQRDMLAQKIISGGAGNWNMGRAMPAHHFIEEAEALKMVSYILSLADRPLSEKKAVSGVLRFDQARADASGTYTLEISYEDRGGEDVGPIKRSRKYTWLPPILSASSADHWQGVAQRANSISLVQESGAYLMYQNIDIRQISSISVRLKSLVKGRLEVRLNDPKGELVASAELDKNAEWHEVAVPLEDTATQQDLYFVFRSDQAALPSNLFMLDSFHFLKDEPEL